jgi:hypothetical protein
MDLSNIPAPAGDPRTQAIDSLRGYVYQLYTSALAWLSLAEDEVLYLEVAKDYAVAALDALNAVEVKNTQANVTINSEDVRETLDQFVDLVERNPGHKVRLRFLTTSHIGTEQSVEHRAASEPTLSYWAKAASGADVAPLRDVLLRVKLKDRVHAFIKARTDNALRAEFVQPIMWDCGAPPLGELKAQLELALATYGMKELGLSADEGKRLAATMLQRLLETAAKLDPSSRPLTREQLRVMLDESSRMSLPRKDVAAALRLITSSELTREALERDLALRYDRALRRATFPETLRADPFQLLAQEILQGGGNGGSAELRRRILLRAARSAALRNNIAAAETDLAAAQALDGPDSDLSARARIAEARGEPETAIALLRGVPDPDAQATLLGVLANARGDAHALAWLEKENIAVDRLPANGVITWSQIFLRQEDFDAVEVLLNTITPRQIDECPYLLLLRGAVRFATLLPKPDRKLPLSGLQLDVRRVQPIYPDDEVTARLDAAARDFHQLLPIVTGLELREATRLIEDYLVWFDLVHPARRAAALQRLRADMAEPGRALSRIQFAYAYDSAHFNPEPIRQYLDSRDALVGLTDAELRAAFVIVTHTTDAARVAAFVAKYRPALETTYGKASIRFVEIQALARSGKSADGGRCRRPANDAHHVAAAQNLAGLAGRHGAVLAVRRDHLDAGERPARGGEPRLPARMIAVGDVLFGERGDRHRALALAVDLREPRTEAVERLQRILDVHRRPAPDQGADVAGVTAVIGVDEPFDHGRGREHGGTRPALEQAEDLGRLEAAGLRDDLDPEARHMRHDVEAGAVAHRPRAGWRPRARPDRPRRHRRGS